MRTGEFNTFSFNSVSPVHRFQVEIRRVLSSASFFLLSQFPWNSLNMFPLRRLHFKQEFLSLPHTFHELSMSCLLPLNCTGLDVLTDLYQPTENQVNHLFQCPLTFSLFTNISLPYIQRLNHHR